MNIKVMKLFPDATIPTKAYEYDSGWDIYALEDTLISSGETVVVKTGLAFEIPNGYEMQIRPRSGMSTRTKLRVILGTIDSQYRGEVGVIVDNVNFSILDLPSHELSIEIKKGDRIAQAVFAEVPMFTLQESDSLSPSDRGNNGFGSSGV